MKYVPLLLLSLSILSGNACQKKMSDALAAKSAPNDLFSLQRSFPDRAFDWQGWQKSMRRARQADALQERDNNCSGTLADWTLQGPANIGGRVNSLVLRPGNEQTLLAGFSAGGIFKSTDAGVNWRPVFDEHPELSIGHLTFDPSNSSIVYAGTGDANMPSYVFNGEGIFKSVDAGEHWQYLGLQQAGIISKIIVQPGQPQTIYAAAMGNPYTRTEERGVYKSSDGGQSWQRVLFVSNQAGASDLVMDPSNPQVLYAAFWDRVRNNSESIVFGPHARIYKTTDGGATWNQLGNGLPSGKMGRVGLVISAQNPQKLYAIYNDTLSRVGGIYLTTNGGDSWSAFSISGLQNAYANFGWYFGKIILHPENDNEVYVPGLQLWKKTAATNNWVGSGAGHADIHDLVFSSSGRRYVGNDGGVYFQNSGSGGWTRCENLPTTQFYHTNFNPHEPDTYYGGTQDNGTCKGSALQLNNWQQVFGGDGFRSAFHPDSAHIFWVESQNGAIHKTTDGGTNWQVGQTCLGTSDRCNWDTPYFLSRHNANKLYAGTYRLYNNTSLGSWTPISNDLTDGVVFGNAFHTISCLDESPLVADKLFVGTSDANVWRREAAGAWTNISSGLPNRYVTSVQGSPTLPLRIFVTQSGFRDNEYIPHIHRSDNNGANWTDITGDLPQMPVNDLIVLPGHADSLLFAATDAGVYFSKNGGLAWSRLGQNIPFIPVFDLEHNPIRRQLAAATYARGIWTFPLDSVLIPGPGSLISLSGDMGSSGSLRISDPPQTIQVDAGGSFDLEAPGCQEYTLTPYRNDNPINGVTTFDLVLISKHILDLEPFNTPYKRIAADANRSGAVTSFDIVVLRKLILGLDTAFADNSSWRFVPDDYVFPDPLNPFSPAFPENRNFAAENQPLDNLDFVAIKTGDVNNTANPELQNSLEERGLPWPVLLEDRTFEAGETVSALFSGHVEALAGLQFSLQFDPEKLELERVEPLIEGVTLAHFGTDKTARGFLSLSFETTEGFISSEKDALFRLVFKAKTEGSLAAGIRMSDWPTRALAYPPDGSAQRPVLLSRGDASAYFAAPNPFGRSGCYLYFPELKNRVAELQILDNQGKIIHRQNLDAPAPLYLPAELFPGAGAWQYRIQDRQSGQKIAAGSLIYMP